MKFLRGKTNQFGEFNQQPKAVFDHVIKASNKKADATGPKLCQHKFILIRITSRLLLSLRQMVFGLGTRSEPGFFLQWRRGNDRTCARSRLTEWKLIQKKRSAPGDVWSEEKKTDKRRFVSRLECTGADGSGLNIIGMFDIDLCCRSKLRCSDYIVISWHGFILYILREKAALPTEMCLAQRTNMKRQMCKDKLQSSTYFRSQPDRQGFLCRFQTWCTLCAMFLIWYIQRQLTCFQYSTIDCLQMQNTFQFGAE